jgi:predicted alpha-1,2-mannosidase
MKIKAISIFTLIGLLSSTCSQKKVDPADYVNPYIGNISHLLVPTFPTVHLPNSMIRFYPDRSDFTAEKIKGFPLNVVSHRSGKAFAFFPFTGKAEDISNFPSYSYDNEHIAPYLYQVTLIEPNTIINFSPSEKSGFFNFQYRSDKEPGIILRTLDQGELICNGNSISGYDTFNGVKTFLFMELDNLPNLIKVRINDTISNESTATGKGIVLFASFNPNSVKDLNIRYGLSYISVEQAKRNLQNNIKDWDLNEIAFRGKKLWNHTLSKIEVEGGTENQRTVFYTSLYRCYERMIDITEDGKYFSIWSKKVEPANDTLFYTDDWVWDTYLAMHPLQVLLNPSAQDEKITSYIRMGRQSGWMPTFPAIFGDTHAMNGNHSAAVILDAYNKGIKGFDLKEAYNILKSTILYETKLPWVKDSATFLDEFYDNYGYFPGLKKGEAENCPEVHSFEKRQSVAITLASSFDDWCMSQIASLLKLDDDFNFFRKRSLNYRNLFNKETGFYHPKDKDDKWIEPFDYRYDGGLGARDYYDENNGWTYIWQPYHAFEDLITMMGGPEKMESKLDKLFSESIGKARWQYYSIMPDATGNVGQFVMGNEPSMHIAYLYNLAGKPWKTQKRVRMLMDTWFRNDLMGIPGDEDGGGLSAFYVFSSMGFYQVTPGIPEYQIGSPLFNRVKINLQNGKSFTVVANNNSKDNIYIQSASLNGKQLSKPVVSHDEIIKGGKLILEMGDKPDYTWGTDKN